MVCIRRALLFLGICIHLTSCKLNKTKSLTKNINLKLRRVVSQIIASLLNWLWTRANFFISWLLMGTYTKSWNKSRIKSFRCVFYSKSIKTNDDASAARELPHNWHIHTQTPVNIGLCSWWRAARGGARRCAHIMGLLRCAVILKASARLTLSDLFNWYISARPAHAQRLNTLLSPLLTHYSTTSSQTYHLTGLSLFFLARHVVSGLTTEWWTASG